VIISQSTSTVGEHNKHRDISNICRLIQDHFPITTKNISDNAESFEDYVTREIIALYHLFFILEELENTLINPLAHQPPLKS
jgi:hypothetical protein